MSAPEKPDFVFDHAGTVPHVFVEAWACYEAFRKLGFSDDEVQTSFAPGIFMGHVTDDMIHVGIEQKGIRFNATIGLAKMSFEESSAILLKIKSGIMSGEITPAEMLRMWDASLFADLAYFMSFTGAIIGKGIDPPTVVEEFMHKKNQASN